MLAALALTLRHRELADDAAAEGKARAHQHWAQAGTYPDPTARREDPTNPDSAAALPNLPVGPRAVVVLRYDLDWSEAATADALGIAPGAVKSRLNRAPAVLRSDLCDPQFLGTKPAPDASVLHAFL